MTHSTSTMCFPVLRVDQVVAVGSVDGICTAAAVLRLSGRPDEVGIKFCQAFTVDKVDPSVWPPDQAVYLVDLAVNNRDPSMTAAFVERMRAAGHTLVAVIDEHSREDWLAALGLSFDELVIEPQSQNAGPDAPKSSGEVLRNDLQFRCALELEEHVSELLDAAAAGDRMDFTTRLGGMVNRAVKSRIGDDSRRVYLARHLASGATEPDETIAGWIAEYGAILANHEQIVAAKVDLGDGIVRAVATGKQVDMTTLMSTLYNSGARVVALEGEAFVPARKAKEVLVAFGTNESLDLLAIVRASGVIPLGGFAQKVNVALDDEAATLAAIRAALRA